MEFHYFSIGKSAPPLRQSVRWSGRSDCRQSRRTRARGTDGQKSRRATYTLGGRRTARPQAELVSSHIVRVHILQDSRRIVGLFR